MLSGAKHLLFGTCETLRSAQGDNDFSDVSILLFCAEVASAFGGHF